MKQLWTKIKAAIGFGRQGEPEAAESALEPDDGLEDGAPPATVAVELPTQPAPAPAPAAAVTAAVTPPSATHELIRPWGGE